MIRIASSSDWHGETPPIPPCDLLLLPGDLVPDWWHVDRGVNISKQRNFWRDVVAPHVLASGAEVVVCAGNHDRLPETPFGDKFMRGLGFHYLCDETIELFGLKIHGSPWSPTFRDWHFMGLDWDLEGKWAMIPDDVDVLLTHGPPFGILDVGGGHQRLGSESLAARVEQLENLQLHVFGHIHTGAGVRERGGTIFANVSLLNDELDAVNEPLVFELNAREGKRGST